MKREVTLKDIEILTRGLHRETSTIENIVKLSGQGKATQYHGMIALLFAIGAFKIYRFCSRFARQILLESGMSNERANYFLDFEKYLGEKGVKGN